MPSRKRNLGPNLTRIKLKQTNTMIDHTLVHEINLNKFKRCEIIHNVFSDHRGVKLEVSNRNIAGKSPNTKKLINTLPINPWDKCKIPREIQKRTLNCVKMKIQHIKIRGASLKQF